MRDLEEKLVLDGDLLSTQVENEERKIQQKMEKIKIFEIQRRKKHKNYNVKKNKIIKENDKTTKT